MSLATLTIDINARLANLEKDLGRVASVSQSTADVIASGFAKASIVVTGINQAFELAGKALTGFRSAADFVTDFVKHTTDAQDQMGKMAQKAGLTTEALSGLAYAADLADVSSEALLKGTKELSKNIIEASRAADAGTTVFGNMGVALKDSAGNLRGTDKILLDLSEKFAGMSDGAGKSALAVKLFGKAGFELIPFLNQGKDGIQALTKEAERLGLIVGGDAARASEQFNDNLKRMNLATEGLKRSIGNNALPLLGELVQQLTDAKMAGGGVADELRQLTSRANIEEWAQGGAKALAWIVDSGRGVIATFQAVGIVVASAAAQIPQLLKGNLEGAKAIGEQARADLVSVFDYGQMRDKVDQWFDEYRRTVRVNGQRILVATAEDAKSAQKIIDDSEAEKRKKANAFYEFDEATLKKQDALREKYSAAEKIRISGEYRYKQELIEKKYAEQLTLVQGAQDQANLEIEIRRQMRAELDALERGGADVAIKSQQDVVAAVASSAQARIAVERDAAAQVSAVWNQANAVKASATGGQIMNAGTPGEFVSSWSADGRYVGDLGRTTSGLAPLGNTYSRSGRRLSVAEEISMLNGFAHYADGGSFTVGGSGGTDSQLVKFMATPGEKVTVQTPAQQREGGATTVNINVQGGDPQKIIAAIRQALRTDPGLFGPGLVRAG